MNALNHKVTKTQREPVSDAINRIAHVVVDSAFKVHQNLGPGLIESVYEQCLLHELKKAGMTVGRQVSLPVIYDGIVLDASLRIDLLVEECVVVELKTVETLLPIHQAQLLTYLKLSGCRLGLLINFNVPLIKDGIKRMAL